MGQVAKMKFIRISPTLIINIQYIEYVEEVGMTYEVKMNSGIVIELSKDEFQTLMAGIRS
jgi:hypothetical protein